MSKIIIKETEENKCNNQAINVLNAPELIVNVVDSIMGSGKTQWAISYMKNNLSKKKFIYVTPFLTEVDRIKAAIPGFKSPEQQKFMTKSGHLAELVSQGHNIAMSHELLKNLSVKQLSLFKDYTLILDETLGFITRYKEAGLKDMEILLEAGAITFDSISKKYSITKKGKGFMTNGEDGKKGKLRKELRLIEEGKLFLYGNKSLMYELPKEIITSFQNIFMMTYLFEGSIAYAFLKAHKIPYKKYQVINKNNDSYEIVDYSESRANERASDYYKLIKLYNGKYNQEINKCIGSLSYKSQDNMSIAKAEYLGNIMRSFFRFCHARQGEVLWSVFDLIKDKAKVKDYSNSYLPHNSRATNKYSHTKTLAYCVSKYIDPAIRGYLSTKYQVQIDEEKLALATLLQWIFRSRIRNGEEINLFLPCPKMRKKLKKWGYLKKL
jgi:hypothetical protein